MLEIFELYHFELTKYLLKVSKFVMFLVNNILKRSYISDNDQTHVVITSFQENLI